MAKIGLAKIGLAKSGWPKRDWPKSVSSWALTHHVPRWTGSDGKRVCTDSPSPTLDSWRWYEGVHWFALRCCRFEPIRDGFVAMRGDSLLSEVSWCVVSWEKCWSAWPCASWVQRSLFGVRRLHHRNAATPCLRCCARESQ